MIVKLPLTAVGGAGSLDDIRQLVARFGVIGAAAGSLFVFKGIYEPSSSTTRRGRNATP